MRLELELKLKLEFGGAERSVYAVLGDRKASPEGAKRLA